MGGAANHWDLFESFKYLFVRLAHMQYDWQAGISGDLQLFFKDLVLQLLSLPTSI